MALTLIGPVCVIGGVMLLHRVPLCAAGTSPWSSRTSSSATPRGSGARPAGTLPALQIHNLDFFYGANQVLFDVNLEVAQGEIVALLGTNGAGKSTLLRAVSGLDHPHRGVIRIFGANCTYLEPEQIIDQDVALLVGGKMTFPGLTVRDNLRIGGYSLRREGSRARSAHGRGHRPLPRAGRPSSTSRPARCRAASSRCWPWPG